MLRSHADDAAVHIEGVAKAKSFKGYFVPTVQNKPVDSRRSFGLFADTCQSVLDANQELGVYRCKERRVLNLRRVFRVNNGEGAKPRSADCRGHTRPIRAGLCPVSRPKNPERLRAAPQDPAPNLRPSDRRRIAPERLRRLPRREEGKDSAQSSARCAVSRLLGSGGSMVLDGAEHPAGRQAQPLLAPQPLRDRRRIRRLQGHSVATCEVGDGPCAPDGTTARGPDRTQVGAGSRHDGAFHAVEDGQTVSGAGNPGPRGSARQMLESQERRLQWRPVRSRDAKRETLHFGGL